MANYAYTAGNPRALYFIQESYTRGVLRCRDGYIEGLQRLTTDPVGSATVTFSGVNANSEIRVYLPDGTEAAGVENCDADHELTWDAYAQGSANNTVTIRIVHPNYRIKEFTYTTQVGSQSIPIQQEPDKWYSNPA